VIAGSGGTPAQTNILYGKRGSGKPWHTMIIRGGGMGASHNMDGHHCAIFPANGANTPVEILESDTPLIVKERGLVTDSGGPGRQRGGIGRQMTLQVPTAEECEGPAPGRTTIAVQAGRFVYPPDGIFKGRPGACARFLKNNEPADPSGLTFLDPGDVISFVSAGGGGYGDPAERDPEAVLKDVQSGYVSVEKAKTAYQVVIDPQTLTLDMDATRNLRHQPKGV